MNRFIVVALLTISLMMPLTAPSAFAAHVFIGIQIGPPPPPPVVAVVPVRPAPGYVWVGGYWYPVANRWVWHQGYWTAAPYPGAYWLGPSYVTGTYFAGYWNGPRGRIVHDHRWDRDRYRDFRGRHR